MVGSSLDSKSCTTRDNRKVGYTSRHAESKKNVVVLLFYCLDW